MLEGDKGYVISPGGRLQETQMKLPDVIKGDFSSFTMDQGRLHLRAVKHADAGSKHLVVISNVPVNSGLLQRTASQVGAIYLYPPKAENEESKTGKQAEPHKKNAENSVTIDLGGSHSTVTIAGENLTGASTSVEGGKGAAADQQLRPRIQLLDTVQRDGLAHRLPGDRRRHGQHPAIASVQRALRQAGREIHHLQALAGIAIFFGIIELIALFIGARLTRSMTKSVAELYIATESVNRGDLTHRIKVESRDQMAALEGSFNSMTTSLARLMADRKTSSAWRTNSPSRTRCRSCFFRAM